MTDSFFERTFGLSLDALHGLTHDQRAGVVRAKIPDLHFFFDEGAALEARGAGAHAFARGLVVDRADLARAPRERLRACASAS